MKPFGNTGIKIEYSDKYKQPCDAEFGNLDKLVTKELIAICKKSKHIIIFGHSKSGKVILGKIIAKKLKCDLIISDDYMNLGWSENMYHIKRMLQDKYKDKQVVFEGIQTARLLRKGIQMNDYHPDLVIHIICNYASIVECYIRDNEAIKLRKNKIKVFNEKVLDKTFFEWYGIAKQCKIPEIIKINTSFIKDLPVHFAGGVKF